MGSMHTATKEKFARIQSLVSEGKGVAEACEEVGMRADYFYKLQGKTSKKPRGGGGAS